MQRKVVEMSGKDINRLYDKLDQLDNKFDTRMTKLIGLTEAQEQHLKNLNGNVARHEKQFGGIWKQFQICSKEKEEKLEVIKTNVDMGRGALRLLSILAVVLAIIATAISLLN